MGSFFPPNDQALRQSTWLSHLGFGRGPIMELMPDLHQCYSEEIARAVTGNTQADRDFRQDNLSDHLVILYLWGGLPDELLEQFWADAPLRMRQRAMWFLGTQLALPDLTEEMRARGLLYWERRLAAARSAADSEPFRMELGAIGQWSMRDQIDDLWLSEQLLSMMRAGFVPTDSFSVVTRLETISTRHVDQALAVLASLLMNPRVDRWAYMTQREPIRAILTNGLANGTAETIARVGELIGFLSSIGETSYLDLIPAPAAE
jgi:hypothetical protein